MLHSRVALKALIWDTVSSQLSENNEHVCFGIWLPWGDTVMPPPTSGVRISINTYSVIIVGWKYTRNSVLRDLPVKVADFRRWCISNWSWRRRELLDQAFVADSLGFTQCNWLICCNVVNKDETEFPPRWTLLCLFLEMPGQEVLRGILLHRTPQRYISDFSRGTVSDSRIKEN